MVMVLNYARTFKNEFYNIKLRRIRMHRGIVKGMDVDTVGELIEVLKKFDPEQEIKEPVDVTEYIHINDHTNRHVTID
jgi:hypothetical protein